MGILGFLGKPLGLVMSWIFKLVPNYFVTIFIFTFLVRLLLFPVSLKQQKSAVDRAKIAPQLERLQKKYANDRQKLAEKQQQLYEKHGVSMTAGCLPMLLSMIVLFGVIAAIYSPLTNLANPAISDEIVSVAQYAIIDKPVGDDEENKIIEDGKVTEKDLQGYYGELRLMKYCDEGTNKADIIAELTNPSDAALTRAGIDKNSFLVQVSERGGAEAIYAQIVAMRDQFTILNTNYSLLDQPWTKGVGFKDINWLWIIPLISGGTSFLVSWISMRNNKKSMPDQPGMGCTNNMMMIYMPAVSLFIAFTVPGAVGLYWIFSNILSLAQTVILHKMYDPAKARAEAEKAYQERRRQKAEDKKRLAQARQREEAEARKAEQELERQREQSREMNKKKKKQSSGGNSAPKNGGSTEAVDDTQTAEGADDSVDEAPVASEE